MAQASLRQAQRLGHRDAAEQLASIEEKVRGGVSVPDGTRDVLAIVNALMDSKGVEDVERLISRHPEFDWDKFLAAGEKLNVDAVGIGSDADWRVRLGWVGDVLGRAC